MNVNRSDYETVRAVVDALAYTLSDLFSQRRQPCEP